uniref:rhamnulokinase n=1 Tax=Enterocloster clostridioformis TaxID=1531 RepID=UPI0026EE53FC|nr:FGGY-family carbohydrate kinase [Enterocloster clostridioformis]
MDQKKVLAVDLGASSGRVMIGMFDGERISIEELHRFSNDPVMLNGTMYWDFLRLFFEIKQGIIKARKHGSIDSIGVDTWGVDFGLVDNNGKLLENPVHYRDSRTSGMLDKSFEKIKRERFYQITGNQFMEINTAFQLMSLLENRRELLERTEALLMMPDLFNYFLCGKRISEYSIASTTQMLDARERVWSREVLERLGIPGRILQPVVPCGTRLGKLTPEICLELGIEPMDVIAVAGHDTQSALAAVPATGEDFIFISCGTWSLFGTELDYPIINQQSERFNITNEGGCQGKVSFLKNIIGLWLIQESRRQWIREGREYNFGHLEQMAAESRPFKSLIDPDAPVFVPAGDVPERIRAYCRESEQEIPSNEAEIVRCIDESLALKYRMAFDEIRECTGKEYPAIHMVGGGTQSGLLCQLTANACGCPVIAGPVEATVLGNVAMQLLAVDAVKDLAQVRRVVGASAQVKVYKPGDRKQWEHIYVNYRKLLAMR